MADLKETVFCKSGGCTAKLGAGALRRILEKLPRPQDPRLLVGFEASDDAAVYRAADGIAIVHTLDFFPPVVEDPYLYGQIAAANALSDVWAMGGKPVTALNIVCFPEALDMNLLGSILQGGAEKVREAGASLAGGHSILDDGVKYGLSVTGIVHPEEIWRNNACQEGDALLLSKPIGVGIVCAAARAGQASQQALAMAHRSMATLNRYAAEVLHGFQTHAVTDVTGFSLLGHLTEMLDGRFSAVLMKGFLYALAGLDRLPDTVLFYNGGAFLTTEGSASLEDLRLLESQGVEILTCGTCLDHYGIKQKLAVGGVTNMYAIAEKLVGAAKVIRP